MIDPHSKILSDKEIEALVPSSKAFIVKIPPVREQTQGGIYIPDVSQNKFESETQKAIIWKIGENAFQDYEDISPQIGHIAIIPRYSFGQGNTFEDNEGTKYIILSDKNLAAFMGKMAVIKDNLISFVE